MYLEVKKEEHNYDSQIQSKKWNKNYTRDAFTDGKKSSKVPLIYCKISKHGERWKQSNKLTGDEKYSLLNTHTLTQPVQILLSQKQKTSSEFFSEFLKSTLNLEHLKKRWPW